MSNNQQKKMGKKLKTYAQALGIKLTEKENDEENNQSKIKETGAKTSKTKRIQKENELKKVIDGMKEQIDKLVLIIKMMCNNIESDMIKKTVEEQLEEVEFAIEKENEVINEAQDDRNDNNNNDMNDRNNNACDIRSKHKIRSHPCYRQNSATGGISQKIK